MNGIDMGFKWRGTTGTEMRMEENIRPVISLSTEGKLLQKVIRKRLETLEPEQQIARKKGKITRSVGEEINVEDIQMEEEMEALTVSKVGNIITLEY